MRIAHDSLLDALQAEEAKGILHLFVEKRYQKKEIIFLPKQADNYVFIVKEGRVRIYLAFADKEFTISILEVGDVYSTHTRAFAQALEDCTLLICRTEIFSRILVDHPTYTRYLVNALGDLLKNCFTIIINLAFMKAKNRLRTYLLAEAEDKGVFCDEGIRVEMGHDLSQMATIIGCSRQTVSTLVNELCRMGILERLDRKTILIKDREALQKLDQQ